MILGPKHLKGRIPLAFCNSGYPTLFVTQSAFRDAFRRVPVARSTLDFRDKCSTQASCLLFVAGGLFSVALSELIDREIVDRVISGICSPIIFIEGMSFHQSLTSNPLLDSSRPNFQCLSRRSAALQCALFSASLLLCSPTLAPFHLHHFQEFSDACCYCCSAPDTFGYAADDRLDGQADVFALVAKALGLLTSEMPFYATWQFRAVLPLEGGFCILYLPLFKRNWMEIHL